MSVEYILPYFVGVKELKNMFSSKQLNVYKTTNELRLNHYTKVEELN